MWACLKITDISRNDSILFLPKATFSMGFGGVPHFETHPYNSWSWIAAILLTLVFYPSIVSPLFLKVQIMANQFHSQLYIYIYYKLRCKMQYQLGRIPFQPHLFSFYGGLVWVCMWSHLNNLGTSGITKCWHAHLVNQVATWMDQVLWFFRKG